MGRYPALLIQRRRIRRYSVTEGKVSDFGGKPYNQRKGRYAELKTSTENAHHLSMCMSASLPLGQQVSAIGLELELLVCLLGEASSFICLSNTFQLVTPSLRLSPGRASDISTRDILAEESQVSSAYFVYFLTLDKKLTKRRQCR